VDRVHESPFSLLLNASGILKFGILLGFGVLGIGFSDALPSNSPHFQSISNFFKAKKPSAHKAVDGFSRFSVLNDVTIQLLNDSTSSFATFVCLVQKNLIHDLRF
jgi:hypothetical protein